MSISRLTSWVSQAHEVTQKRSIPKLGFSGVPSDINQASYADFYLCSVDCQG